MDRSIWRLGRPRLAGIVCWRGGADAIRTKIEVRSGLAQTLAEQVEDGRREGLAVDKNDNVWVLDRPNDLMDTELHAAKNPPLPSAARALHQ